MATRFAKITRSSVRKLASGQKLVEHGIEVERLRTGDTRYSINVMVDGARIHRVVGRESEGVTREQAERLIEKFRTEARERRLSLPAGRKLTMSLSDAADQYIAKLSIEGGKGIARKTQHLRDRLKPRFKCRLDALTESAVNAFARARIEEGAQPSTVNRELATLSHFLNRCVRWGWLNRDKAPFVSKLKEGRGRVIALTDLQCADLLRAAVADEDSDLWLFVLICLHTSMRHGEARRLRWEHFDADRRRFYIPEAKAGEREQPVSPELAKVLVEQRAQRKVQSGYVFKPGPGSETEYRHTFRKAFRRAAKAARLDPDLITPHVLRHTAITKLVKAGVDLPTIQRVSGHKTLTMVLRYSHVDGNHIDEAVAKLAMPVPVRTVA